MSVIRVDNFIDAYRLRAQGADVHAMAARRKEGTAFISEYILNALQLEPSATLVDVGCGDGCLLRMAAGRVSHRVGIVPNAEEKLRLEPIVEGAAILQGLCQQVPLASASADLIICNAVFMYLSSAEEVKSSLRELAHIARPGARIWIGEIPVLNEFEKFGMYRGHSIFGLLRHTLTMDGPRAFLGMVRRLGNSWMGLDQLVLNSANLFHATPEQFLALAEGSGLQLESYGRHRELDKEGNSVVSPFRYDYVFWR